MATLYCTLFMKMAEKAKRGYGTMESRSNGEFSSNDNDNDNETNQSKTAKDEIKEWMTVNRKLRRQGLSSVRILPSEDVDLQTGRYVCLDLGSSLCLRSSLASLITELGQKDNVVEDLTKTVVKLQEEISELSDKSAHATSKAKDIKVMLECSRARVQELEELQSHSSNAHGTSTDETERLRNTKQAMGRKCRQLEAKVSEQEKELERLRREVLMLVQEDDRRSKRQNQVFSEFRNRTSRPNSAMDQKMLDVIDSYENQIQELQKEISRAGRSETGRDFSNSHSSEPSRNFKAIIKSYERQIKEKDKIIHELECEKDATCRDLESRPEIIDYRVLAQRVKKLERLLSLHNIIIPGEKQVKDPFYARKKFSTRLEDLDYLPLEQCHQYLREICRELEVDNLNCLTGVLEEMKEEGSNSDRFMEYCRELSEIVESVNEPHGQRSRLHCRERNMDAVLCDSNMRYYLDVVSNWCKDISCLDELQAAINTMLDKAVPWMRAHVASDHSVSDMAELLERVAHADRSPCHRTVMEEVSRACLEEVVSHFQTLFDTPRISGVLPRMNEVYRVLGEMRNVQNTLKTQLGLATDAHSSALVDAVGKICHMHNSTTAKQLKRLLQTDDLNGVIRRLDEHTEFFPAFHCIMHKLFDVLGVDRMDEVIPAVRALKLLAS